MEGKSVFYYNKWRGVDFPELRACFRQLSANEIAGLKQGDEVWIDGEPYHLNGKVYGFTQIVYPGKEKDNFLQLFKCVNPKKLEALVTENGEKVLSPISNDEKRAFKVFCKTLENGNYKNN